VLSVSQNSAREQDTPKKTQPADYPTPLPPARWQDQRLPGSGSSDPHPLRDSKAAERSRRIRTTASNVVVTGRVLPAQTDQRMSCDGCHTQLGNEITESSPGWPTPLGMTSVESHDNHDGRLFFGVPEITPLLRPLSPATIYRLVRSGVLPSVTVGGRRLVLATDLVRFLADLGIEPAEAVGTFIAAEVPGSETCTTQGAKRHD